MQHSIYSPLLGMSCMYVCVRVFVCRDCQPCEVTWAFRSGLWALFCLPYTQVYHARYAKLVIFNNSVSPHIHITFTGYMIAVVILSLHVISLPPSSSLFCLSSYISSPLTFLCHTALSLIYLPVCVHASTGLKD